MSQFSGPFNGSIAKFHLPGGRGRRYSTFVDLDALVDTARYPIDAPDSAAYRDLVAAVRAELAGDGCSVVRGLFRPEVAEATRSEARTLAPLASVNDHRTNAYSTSDDPSLPAEHPVRLFMERTNAFVPREAIPESAAIHRLYRNEHFQRFVGDCMQVERIFEYADPYAGLVINVLHPGSQHPWHFDNNEFIASMLLQEADEGGVFEYCPGIRTAHDENHDQVSAVIRGIDEMPVRRLRLRIGDLQLFQGRFALHRVTRVGPGAPRLTAIFAYAERPDVIGSPDRTRLLFGRVSEAHLAAARDRKAAVAD